MLAKVYIWLKLSKLIYKYWNNFLKAPFGIPQNVSYPYIERCILYTVKIYDPSKTGNNQTSCKLGMSMSSLFYISIILKSYIQHSHVDLRKSM